MIRAIPAVSVVSLVMFVCLVFIACDADAASGVMIHGYVLDRDRQAVANATVVLLKNEVPLPTSSNPALTDTNGYYAFWGIERGQYCLVASKGAHSLSNTILVQEWDVMQDFTLQATSAELSDTPRPTASPAPTVTPAPTAAPTAPATPVPPASSGFGVFLLLPGAGAAVLLIIHGRNGGNAD